MRRVKQVKLWGLQNLVAANFTYIKTNKEVIGEMVIKNVKDVLHFSATV